MFFSGRSKHLPNLSEYLEKKVQEQRARGARMGIVGGIIGTVGGLTGAALGILGGTGVIAFSTGGVVAAVIGLNLLCWAGVLAFYIWDRKRVAAEKKPERKHQADSERIAGLMYQS